MRTKDGGALMLTRLHAAVFRDFAAVLVAMMPIWLAGCDSKQAGASGSMPATGGQVDSTLAAATGRSATKPRPKLRPARRRWRWRVLAIGRTTRHSTIFASR